MLTTSQRRQTNQTSIFLYVLCLIISLSSLSVRGFYLPVPDINLHLITSNTCIGKNFPLSTAQFSSIKDNEQRESTYIQEVEEEEEDPDAPAGIGGAEFFGGSQDKDVFYDPVAEREAGNDIEVKATSYNRFYDVTAFDTVEVASLARSLQSQINQILYSDDKKMKWIIKRNENDDITQPLLDLTFGSLFAWETPMTVSKSPPTDNGSTMNPIDELKKGRQFYEEIDLAIVSGKKLSDDVFEFSWELSLVWPTFWAPRVFLSGTSTCTLADSLALQPSNDEVTTANRKVFIIKQVDNVFGTDAGNSLSFVSILGSQIIPRFWDWYHIGMTPSAEQLPRRTIAKKRRITVYQLPPQLVTAPTIVETGTRENRHAEMIPNHAFTCIIRTMGPKKKNNYVPTTPVEVQIGRNNDDDDDDRLRIKWSIPLSTQFQALNNNLPLPGDNPEDDKDSFPTCDYEWQPLRQVATTRFGGNVQDLEISGIRKRLYAQVLKDGWKPKLDQNGKPQFFFWQNIKACYIEDGFGMSVYDWRPKFAGSNEVGIELVVDTV
mmetsp:Transcript_53752/g.60042  ORF Transcript_53752/g.60042 Transcript_53752/m.60042 type:complete len:547 (-) Transcript_53752:38-1678(-)